MSWWTTSPFYVVLIGLAGIVVWHSIPRRLAMVRLVVQIPFFLAMSGLFLIGPVVPFEPAHGAADAEAIVIATAKVLWWVHLAWALIGFVRIYIVIERKPREARLLQDLVVGVVYLGMLLSILAFVFGMPVGTLIATSGVFAIVLGLALQNTLSDLFSGIALNLGRPFVIGDWIVLSDGTEGRVIESNWRSTHLLTLAHNVVALPNSFLAKLGLTNVSSPDESHGLSLVVRLAPTKAPAFVVNSMQAALSSSNTIQKMPPPLVAIRSIDAVAIELELSFRISHLDRRTSARNEVFDLVYRHSRSNGLSLAVPPSASIALGSLPGEGTVDATHFTAVELIRTIPIFSALTAEEQAALASTAALRAYRKGDVIARRGEMLPSLMIIRTGVIVRQDGDDVHPQDIDHLAPGDFFGETGLLAGIGETATLRAASRVVVYEIDQQSFAPLLRDRPEMAEDLAAILSARMSTIGETGATGQQRGSSKSALLNAIRTVSHAVPYRRGSNAGRA